MPPRLTPDRCQPLRSFSITLLLLATLLSGGCTDYEEEAKQAVGNTLANRRDAEYQNLQKYPGKVVCGEVAETDRWGPTLEFRRFIVRDGVVINRPGRDDLAIYCSKNPQKSLETLLKSGPLEDNPELMRVMSDMVAIDQALRDYLADNKTLPTTEEGLAALITPLQGTNKPLNFRAGGYLQAVPVDPWGKPYQYWRSPLAGAVAPTYKFYTLGADGKKGGSGPDTDIGREQLGYLLHVTGL